MSSEARRSFSREEDQSEFSEERRLGIWWFLSKFIGFPTELHVEKSKEREVTDSEKNEADYRGGR